MTAPEVPGVAQIRGTPEWFPLEALAGGAVRLLRLDEAAYRAASFLDQRLLQGPCERVQVPGSELAAAARGLPASALYVFHTGHVGSTLLSRLLGEHPALFALREPALLRSLADTRAAERPGSPATAPTLPLEVVLPLLARSWRPKQRALIKATSFVSELAGELLTESGEPPAIFVFAQPLAYLRGIFGGPNSRVETRALAPARLRRLVHRLGDAAWRSDPRSEGEAVAMSWLCEMLALHQAALPRAGIVWVDFDTFLAEPARGLARIFRGLGVAADEGELRALTEGPLMRQYAKAPEFAYDAALRREVLAAADQDHGEEIRRAMQWLQRLAAQHAAVRALFEFLDSPRT
jgi:hypothetical protein